ncbi:MAG: hypothetical protein ACLQVL_36815 [Terriglobia bacterium]
MSAQTDTDRLALMLIAATIYAARVKAGASGPSLEYQRGEAIKEAKALYEQMKGK